MPESSATSTDSSTTGLSEFIDRIRQSTWLQTFLDYRELTKPRIVHLLVLTTFCTMLVAARGLPSLSLVIWTVLGTTLVCGSAQTINMVWDKDIDAVMERTADRPIVQGRIQPMHAMLFAGVIGFAGVMILTYLVNPLAAAMGMAGHAYYVVIYTMWLKRRTPQNIVIGGAAGAFPPLIGWAAVTGSLSLTAWLIFAVIFLWTPPHFWALALYKDVDYEAAGVPMMPVARGERETKFQVLLYMSLLLGASVLLGLTGLMGIIYLASAVVLGGVFAYCCVQMAFSEGNTWPKRTFACSIAYLALLFGAMSVDSLYTAHFTPDRHLESVEREASKLREQQSVVQIRDQHNQSAEDLQEKLNQ